MRAPFSEIRRKPRPGWIEKRWITDHKPSAFADQPGGAPAGGRQKIGFGHIAAIRQPILQEIFPRQSGEKRVILQEADAQARPRDRQGQASSAHTSASVDGKAGKIGRSRRREKHGVGAAPVTLRRLPKQQPSA
jgi:hypothetical protein